MQRSWITSSCDHVATTTTTTTNVLIIVTLHKVAGALYISDFLKSVAGVSVSVCMCVCVRRWQLTPSSATWRWWVSRISVAVSCRETSRRASLISTNISTSYNAECTSPTVDRPPPYNHLSLSLSLSLSVHSWYNAACFSYRHIIKHIPGCLAVSVLTYWVTDGSSQLMTMITHGVVFNAPQYSQLRRGV